METKNLAELYDLSPLQWGRIQARLTGGVSQAPGSGGPDRHTCWLTTIDPDGGPHVTGIGALWRAGTFWFEPGPQTRKGRNLARDPRCAVSPATREFDLVNLSPPVLVGARRRLGTVHRPAVMLRLRRRPGRRAGPG